MEFFKLMAPDVQMCESLLSAALQINIAFKHVLILMCFCGRALNQCVCLCFMQQKHIKDCQALLAAPSGFTIKDIIKLKNTYKHFIISTFSFIWAAAWIPAVCCRG